MKITQIDGGPIGPLLEVLREEGETGNAAFTTDTGCSIIHGIAHGCHGDLRHVSISHPSRYPTWEEIKEARAYFFKEDEDAMMVLPRKELYVNVHKNCFHLWQMPFRWEYL